MPRNPRPDYSHTYHHIVVRGVDGLPIFDSDQDKQMYLDIIKDVRSTHDLSIYAFGFLSNHVHLLVRRNEQKLGRFFRRVNGRFAQWYNITHNRTGSLYDGRYYSSLVEKEDYLLALIQYIHNQGVEAGLYETPEEDSWNTARLYAGVSKRFDWIDSEHARFELFDTGEAKDPDFVETSEIVDDWLTEGLPTERIRDQLFLASENYIEKYIQIRKRTVRENERDESPICWQTLLEFAEDESGIDSESLTTPSKQRNLSRWRSGLAYAGRRYGHLSLSELAEKMAVSPSGISRMIKRIKNRGHEMKFRWDQRFQH